MALCGCRGVMQNTAASERPGYLGLTTMLVLGSLYDADGSVKELDATSEATLRADIIARLGAEDPKDRLYPIYNFENALFPNEGIQYNSFSNGTRQVARKGLRSMTAEILDATGALVDNINDNCTKMVVFRADSCDKLLGRVGSDETKLRGEGITTLTADFEEATDARQGYGMLSFDYEPYVYEKLKDRRIFEGLDNINDVVGMLTAEFANVTVDSATEISFQVFDEHGYMNDKNYILGLVDANVFIVNETTAATVATSITYNSVSKTYTATFAAQTAGNTLEVKVLKSATEIDEYSYYGLTDLDLTAL